MAIQARTEFASALNQIASEKGVDVATVISAIEQAALAAYRKDLSLRGEEIPEDFDSLVAKVDPVSGGILILRGDENITPPGFARIAAQTAKQVIMQRLNEAEKGAIMDEYAQKVGTVIAGTIQRQEGNTYFVDLGRAEGVMPPSEQTRSEYYHINQRLKFFIKEIRETSRGPEVVVSRSDAGLIKGLFAQEVPEIQAGSVVIKDVAREAGGRTKIAAVSTQEGVDPVGSLVGQKGVRVQAVIQELGEEKVDIVPYSEDLARFIASALSPAKEVEVRLEEKEGEKVAKVRVPDAQLSLAIGKGGQNVRLAAKLTGYKIDIEGSGVGKEEVGTHEKDELSTSSKKHGVELFSDENKEDLNDTDLGGGEKARIQENVKKAIGEAVEKESLDGAVKAESSEKEQAKAAEDAEADMAGDGKIKKDEPKDKS